MWRAAPCVLRSTTTSWSQHRGGGAARALPTSGALRRIPTRTMDAVTRRPRRAALERPTAGSPQARTGSSAGRVIAVERIRDPWLRALCILLVLIAGLYLAGMVWALLIQFADILVLF